MATNIIDDIYEHEDSNLEYILENILCENLSNEVDVDDETLQLKQLFNSQLINSCNCSTYCNDIQKCFHGGNYVWNKLTKPPELVLSQARNSDLLYECNFECLCHKDDGNCLNRLVQFGPRKHLKIIDSTNFKSKGLITTVDIPKGAFICEYAGEILTINEARKRTNENEQLGKMNYILCLNEMPQEMVASEQQNLLRNITIIDPSRYGNIGRYLNHSCDPNCEIFSIRVDCPIPKVCIFSKRSIQSGEELCFHYGGGKEQISKPNEKKIPCLCNSHNCKNFLPNFPF